MYANIIIGCDDSPFSQAAVREITAWLKRHGGQATLVHGVYFDEEEFGHKPQLLRERSDKGHAACDKVRAKAEAQGITMPVVVREGEPPEVITGLAAETGADLIALGTYGRRGLTRLVMGSVTAKVIMAAPCDVLVVKNECDACAGIYPSVLVPFDGSPAGRKALEIACRFAKEDGSAVTLFYVIPRYEEMIGFFKTESVKQNLRDEARKILDSGVALAAEHEVRVDTLISDGHAADRIIETVTANRADLIVMGSHGWRGLDKAIMGSTAERVIMAADCPVLVTR